MIKNIFFIFMCCFFLNTGFAQVTYNYTGNNYNSFEAPYTANSQIVGSFEIASALSPSTTTDLTNTLQTFSFSDGQATRDETNTLLCDFSLTTDASGNIVSWSIYMRQNNTGPTENQHAIDIFPNIEQSGFDTNLGNTTCDSIGLSPLGSSDVTVTPSAWSGGPVPPAPVQPVPTLSLMSLLALCVIMAILGFSAQHRFRKS